MTGFHFLAKCSQIPLENLSEFAYNFAAAFAIREFDNLKVPKEYIIKLEVHVMQIHLRFVEQLFSAYLVGMLSPIFFQLPLP